MPIPMEFLRTNRKRYRTTYVPTPTALRREGRMLAFSFEYSEKMVAALKAKIPKDSRWWDGDRGVWFIKPAYAQWVIGLVRDVLSQDIEVKEEEA